MTTALRIEANWRNALASTGPQTAEGKAIVSGNAIRHGLLSWKPTIPELESVEEWEAHLERTLESLAPVGYMETLLAERVALLQWRLVRVRDTNGRRSQSLLKPQRGDGRNTALVRNSSSMRGGENHRSPKRVPNCKRQSKKWRWGSG